VTGEETQTVEFTFRPMCLEDVEQVRAIDVLSFSMPWPERSFRYEITQNESSRTWVAEALWPDGRRQVAALLVIWLILDEAHIGTFAVHPDFRRQRIGQRLLARALLAAQKEGALKSFLEVRQGNASAQALYARFGYEVVGKRPHYYHDNNEDALLLTLEPLDPQKLEQLAA
jgi:ribosomal-protein-alanine N-acetyltransferase